MSQQPRPGVSYAAATSSTSTDPTITTSTSTTSATPKRRRRVQVEEKSSPIRKFLNYPAVHVVIFVGIVVALGITWDAIYHTAYSTSKFDLRPKAAAHVWYFADKRNILNRIFVKRAAAWTTFGFLIPHAIFSPSRHHHPYFPSKPHRALEIGLYLVAWYVVTGWMTSYVRTTTGAVCQLPLPPQLAQNPSFSSLTRIDQLPIVRADDSGDVQSGTTFINVPQEYCSYGRNINPSAFPELFSLLKPRTKQLAEEGLYKPFNVDSTDFRARFFEGFDLSGHVFLLFASMAIITRQLAPALKMVYERGTLVEAPGKRIGGVQLAGHALSMVVGLGLVSMWSFMLWTTSAYFHTVPEKIAGYLVGIGAIFYIHLVSRSATAVAPNYFPRHG